MQALPPHAVLEGAMQRSHVIVVTMDGKRFSCPRDPLASASLTLRELFQFQQSQTPPSSSSTQSTTTTTTTMASQTAVNGSSSSGSSSGGATAVSLPNNNNNNNSGAMNDLLETTAMPELPLHNIDSHTFVSVYEYIHQKHAASSTGAGGGGGGASKAAGKQGQSGSGSASASSSSLERPLRGDLATVLEPWDWKYCVDTLLKGWTPPAPAAMAAFAMAAASGNGGDRLAASTTSSTPPPTGGRTPSSSSAAATDPTPSNNNNNSNNNAAVVSAALAFGPMSSAAMMNVFHVMNAANTLEIGPLRELCGALIAHCVRNRSEEDILHLFGVTDGSFTKEAEEALCNEFPWLKE